MVSIILLESGWNTALNALFSKGADYTNQTGSELYMIGWGLLTGNDPTAYRTLYPDQIPTMDTIRDAWKNIQNGPATGNRLSERNLAELLLGEQPGFEPVQEL